MCATVLIPAWMWGVGTAWEVGMGAQAELERAVAFSSWEELLQPELLLWCPLGRCFGMAPQGLSPILGRSAARLVWLHGLEASALPGSRGVELAQFCKS